MNYFFKFLCPMVALLLLQSCDKEDTENEVIIDPFTHGKRVNWREDSIKTDNGYWTKIEKGNVFAWLPVDTSLQTPGGFAVYDDRTNINADFTYSITKDSVFSYRLSSDTIYFLDKNGDHRTDIKGPITFSPDTSLILHNTAVSPGISIKYRIEK